MVQWLSACRRTYLSAQRERVAHDRPKKATWGHPGIRSSSRNVLGRWGSSTAILISEAKNDPTRHGSPRRYERPLSWPHGLLFVSLSGTERHRVINMRECQKCFSVVHSSGKEKPSRSPSWGPPLSSWIYLSIHLSIYSVALACGSYIRRTGRPSLRHLRCTGAAREEIKTFHHC